MRDFISVNAEAYATYGMPPEVLADVFDEVAAVLADPAASIVVARRDDAARRHGDGLRERRRGQPAVGRHRACGARRPGSARSSRWW